MSNPTPPPELSPAAQVVLDAFRTSHTGQGCLAAALRAAAYQVAPPRPALDSCCEHFEQAIRHRLLALAAELDPQ